MTSPGRSQTIVAIQVLRAVAALGVVITHARFDLVRLDGPTNALPDFSLGNAGVDLFFVISGFVMVYASEPLFARRNGPLVFFTHRAIRIVPLYWLVTTYYLILTLVIPAFSKDYPAEVVTASYLFIPVPRPDGIMQPLVGQGWTLNYEMLFYVVFACAVLAPRRAAVAVASLALVAIVIAGRLFAPLPATLAYWSDPIVLEFILGMAIGLAYREGLKLPRALALALIAVGALQAVFGRQFPSAEMRFVNWGIPAALIVAGATLGRLSLSAPAWRPLAAVGDASYALYLMHPTPIRAILHAARWAGIDVAQVAWLYVAAAVITSVALALAIYALFERPVTAALRRGATFARLPRTLDTAPVAARPVE